MTAQGRDCAIVIRTDYREMGIPYSEETVREAAVILREEASIEGDGVCGGIRKSGGATGCVVAPLALGTAPLLLALAMGGAEAPEYVSETRNLYRYALELLPAEDGARFDVVQERGGLRRVYGGCVTAGFELRINWEQAVKLKLDIRGEQAPAMWPYQEMAPTETGERFMGDRVRYWINGKEHLNIYGLTIAARKQGGTRTELRLHRVLQPGADFPGMTAYFCARYENQKGQYGTWEAVVSAVIP
ncbi:MAG: hypothetical protein LBL76_04910 [Treponema sp.]|jgi:hypothetical protein|nr:hypothetical protein [Treponema sp.]